MATEMRSPNVSVTPINVEPYPPVSISGDDRHLNQNGPHATTTTTVITNGELFDSSDAEVAQIDFQSAVNLRNKKKRAGLVAPEMPRPMSWEGELSDGEKDMCVDEDSTSQVGPFKKKNKTHTRLTIKFSL